MYISVFAVCDIFDDVLSTLVDMSWLLNTTIDCAFDLAVRTAKIHAQTGDKLIIFVNYVHSVYINVYVCPCCIYAVDASTGRHHT